MKKQKSNYSRSSLFLLLSKLLTLIIQNISDHFQLMKEGPKVRICILRYKKSFVLKYQFVIRALDPRCLLSALVSVVSKYPADISQNPDTDFTMFSFPDRSDIRNFS